jgi:hypothetical protein
LLQRAAALSLCVLLAGAKHHYQQQGVRAACSFTSAKKWSKKLCPR